MQQNSCFGNGHKPFKINQSDGSISLIVQTGFLAKNQLSSICPDPIVIPNLARTCKREHLDRILCPIRALKFYLKMTSSYVRIELDYSYQLKVFMTSLRLLYRDG